MSKPQICFYFYMSFPVMSHSTCETCICFMLKVFINFMFVWLSLLKGVVGGCVLFTCHGQFLSHPNVVTHPKLSFRGKRYSPAGYPSLVWSPLKKPKLDTRMDDTQPEGLPVQSHRNKSNNYPGQA